MRRLELWALAGLLLTACGDDEEGKSAPQKCHDLINTFCDRVTHCAVEGDILDEDYAPSELEADCREAVGEALPHPCEEADDVSDDYSECLADVKVFSCEESNDSLLNDDAFAGPPPSCMMSILFVVDE
jgi:hypothetical protein